MFCYADVGCPAGPSHQLPVDAVCKDVVPLTLFHIFLCYQTPEEDLNLDSAPTVEDTVEEVTTHVFLHPGYLGGRRSGGECLLRLIAREELFGVHGLLKGKWRVTVSKDRCEGSGEHGPERSFTCWKSGPGAP